MISGGARVTVEKLIKKKSLMLSNANDPSGKETKSKRTVIARRTRRREARRSVKD